MSVGTSRVRTREAPDVRRAQLLDAARELIVERGVRATTMAAVAETAGVAKGTTYLYFASKGELVEALRAEYLADFAAVLRSSDEASPVERLDRFVHGLFQFAADHHVLHHALIHDAGTSESDAMAGAYAILEPIVAEGAHAGTFAVHPDDVALTTTFVLHGIHGAVVAALHGADHHPPIDGAVAQLTELAHRAVGVEPG